MKRIFIAFAVAVTTTLSSISTFAATDIVKYNPFSCANITLVPEEDVILGNSNDFTCHMPPPIVTSPPVVINKNTPKKEGDILAYKYGTTIVWVINGEKHKGTTPGQTNQSIIGYSNRCKENNIKNSRRNLL